MDTDVLICGAGASGLTLGVELARRGVSFAVVEQRSGPFIGSRGKGIQPRTLEVFEDLGVVDQIAASGGYYPPVRFYERDGSFEDRHVMSTDPGTPSEPYRRPLMVPQWATEGVLRSRLAELGHLVQFGTRLASFVQDHTGVRGMLVHEDEEIEFYAKYLVGADGGRSFVRSTLEIEFDGRTLPVRTVIADVELDGLSRTHWHRWGTGDHQAMIAPLRGSELFQIIAPVDAEYDEEHTAESLTRLVMDRCGPNHQIAVRAVHWASTFGTNERVARRYRVGRVLLAGDAAHVHPPTGGLGLNTSVQDAYNLGWRLAAAVDGSDRGLERYEEERRGIALGVVDVASKLLVEHRGSSNTLTRTREVHQLDLTYRETCEDYNLGRADRRVLAGDRAPDARIVGAGGLKGRLFSRYWGTHWTLMAYGFTLADSRRLPGVRVLEVGDGLDVEDVCGDIAAAYDLVPGEWVLVRPDGYVGATGDAENVGAVEDVMTDVGVYE